MCTISGNLWWVTQILELTNNNNTNILLMIIIHHYFSKMIGVMKKMGKHFFI